MSNTARDEFYAQLLPIEADRVLLPAAAVGETLNMENVVLNTGSPAWLLGFSGLGGRSEKERLPVVSIEGMLGRNIPVRSSRTRIARIYSLTGGSDWMMVIQGQPHLAPLNSKALQSAPLDTRDPVELVLSRGRIANLSAFIPDLEVVEKLIAGAVAQSGGAAGQLPDWEPGSSLT